MSPLIPPEWESIEAPAIAVEPPGPRSREILERIERTAYPGLSAGLTPLALERKRAWTVTDVDGNVYLDCASASASVPLGAGRPELLPPVTEALARLGNEDSHALVSELTARLGERLLELSPASTTRYDIALNGTEAVEIAIKIMRRATGRPVIIGFHGSYHGESTLTAALGAEAAEISRGLRGLVPGFVHVPYPHPYRTPLRDPRPGGTGDATVDYLRDHLLFHALDPSEVAGVMIEPVLGSGGCLAPPESFWPALVDLCREHGWLLCADEVKSGIGRAGELFAVDRWGVEPDLICLGKALGGGAMPIGALLGSARALGGFDDVPTGSTWAWLPASCAAAVETHAIFEREPVLENVRELERLGAARLAELAQRFERIGDVRAVGCFMAIEFVADRETKERDPELQQAVAAAAFRRGLLADSSTASLNVQPSLVMPVPALERAFEILAESIEDAVAGARP
jgi:4-aminobutyrate aminotransferase-like enzyme